MNVVLVLSLVPMIQAGTGLNFGMPLGVEAGLLGAVISIEMGLKGMPGFLMAIFIATIFGIIFGWIYGLILNKVKGGEMMIATYIGFSSVALIIDSFSVFSFSEILRPSEIWPFFSACNFG